MHFGECVKVSVSKQKWGRTNNAHTVLTRPLEERASATNPTLRVRDAVQALGDGEEGVEDEEGAGEAGEGGHFSRGDFFVS